MNGVVFVYEKDGKPYGFAATKDKIWPQKTMTKDAVITTLYPVDHLKYNLKRLLKLKIASKLEAGTTKAVVVPTTHALGLCLPPSQDTNALKTV